MKKLLLTVISLFVSLIAMSQDVQLEGNFLSRRYNKITYDTNYIKRPDCKWTFKLRTMTLMQTFHTKGEFEGTTFESNLSTGLKPKLNVQVGYMGIALAGGISFNKLKGGQDRDFDIKLNMYGKKFGFELGLSGIESLRGDYILDVPGMSGFPLIYDNDTTWVSLPIDVEVPEGKVCIRVIVLNLKVHLQRGRTI